MQAIRIVPIAIALSACGFDPSTPCTSALYNGLTPEQQQSCDECSNYLGCDADETGGEADADDVGLVTVFGPGDHKWRVIGFVGDVTADLGAEAGAFDVQAAADCEAITGPVPCGRHWATPDSGSLMCVSCDLLETDLVRAPEPPDGWGICAPGDVGSFWHAATWSDETLPVDGWAAALGCYPSSGEKFVCPEGQIAMVDGSDTLYPNTFNWTCRCGEGSDASCQPGAVCEAGWQMDGGFPRPTLCTWDDGSGTANGFAPEGPEVYGLEQWSDGIRIDGQRVTMTTDMLIALPTGAINDDQRFGFAGEFTHCGPDSLCAHLGLSVGDMVMADQDTIDALAGGRAVDVPVQSPTGEERVFSVSIE
jgi:hypothetical protein